MNDIKLTNISDSNVKFILNNYKKKLQSFGLSKNNNFIKFLFNTLKNAYKNNLQHQYVREHVESNPFEHIKMSYFIEKEYLENAAKTINYKYNCVIKYDNFSFFVTFFTKGVIKIDNYIEMLKIIFYICLNHVDKKSKTSFTIDIILSSGKKSLPNKKGPVLPKHINSGYTILNGNSDNYMLIYRSEEWVKVLLHECFHIFCLDINEYTHIVTKIFRELFNIHSRFLLNETIVEFWARTLNCALSTIAINPLMSYHDFSIMFNLNLNIEKIWAFHQSKRLLNNFGLSYDDIILDQNKTQTQDIIFKEETNAFNYIILTAVLLYDFDRVISWFVSNNDNVMNFEKDEQSLMLFIAMIKDLYKNKETRDMFKNTEKINNKGFSFSVFELKL